MNFVDGLKSFKSRKRLSNADLSRLLGVSDSMISQYLSGKSGMSLDSLSILLMEGMTLEEAFGEPVASAVKKNIVEERPVQDSLKVVVSGLRKLLDSVNL